MAFRRSSLDSATTHTQRGSGLPTDRRHSVDRPQFCRTIPDDPNSGRPAPDTRPTRWARPAGLVIGCSLVRSQPGPLQIPRRRLDLVPVGVRAAALLARHPSRARRTLAPGGIGTGAGEGRDLRASRAGAGAESHAAGGAGPASRGGPGAWFDPPDLAGQGCAALVAERDQGRALSMLPPERRRFLATLGRRSTSRRHSREPRAVRRSAAGRWRRRRRCRPRRRGAAAPPAPLAQLAQVHLAPQLEADDEEE